MTVGMIRRVDKAIGLCVMSVSMQGVRFLCMRLAAEIVAVL